MAEKVQITKNYHIFKAHNLTREIREGTKKWLQLEASMLKDGWWESDPMIVLPMGKDGRHIITKGHHRFKIAQKHNIPVKFLIDQQRIEITVRENSGGKPQWGLIDWVFSHLKDGKNPNYNVLVSFQERTRFPMSTAIELYMYGVKGHFSIDVYGEARAGSLRSSDMELAEMVGDVSIFCSDLGIIFSRKNGFARAIAKIIRTGIVDPDTLKKRFKENVRIMKKYGTVTDYVAVINEAYNHRHFPKVDLNTELANRLAEEKKERGKKTWGKDTKQRKTYSNKRDAEQIATNQG